MNMRVVFCIMVLLAAGFTASAQQDSTARFVRYGVFGSVEMSLRYAPFADGK